MVLGLPTPIWCSLAVVAVLAAHHRSRSPRASAGAAAWALAVAPIVFLLALHDAETPIVALSRCGFGDTGPEAYVVFAALWIAGSGLAIRYLFRRLLHTADRALRVGVGAAFTATTVLLMAGLVRSAGAGSWATYVERLPIVGALPEPPADLFDEAVASIGNAKWVASMSMGGVELHRGDATVRVGTGLPGCALRLDERLTLRRSVDRGLWVLEDQDGGRCAVDEEQGAIDLYAADVGASPPFAWHLASGVSAVLIAVHLSRRARRVDSLVVDVGPYRRAQDQERSDHEVRSERADMLIAMAVAAVGCAPSAALAFAGLLF